MKTLIELVSESPITNLATPSDYRLGQDIFEQGGVEIIEIGRSEATARSQSRGGQKRTVTLAATENGLKCRCT